MSEVKNCPSCSAGKMEIFHQLESVPTNSCILLDSPEKAMNYPRGEIQLGFCPECGFISNMAFDQKLTEYSGRYEETQGFSAIFRKFHEALAHRLIEHYDLHGKKLIEIGCGKGEFLVLLCKIGGNTGIGFDPSFVEKRIDSTEMERITFIKDFYSEKYAAHQADFVCCKMTLEHIHPTAEFVSTVRRSIGDSPNTVVFFQIPEATRIVRDCAFEDIYYEHCSYFTPGSVARLFRQCGFEVQDVATEYDDQYLTIEARPISLSRYSEQTPHAKEESIDAVRKYIDEFPRKFNEKCRLWESRVENLKTQNRKTILWGSGSKGVSFLTTLKNVSDKIDYVVDINPFKHGYYMPVTGQKIVAPEFLKEYQPDSVIIMNSIYQEEIGNILQSMNLNPELFAL